MLAPLLIKVPFTADANIPKHKDMYFYYIIIITHKKCFCCRKKNKLSVHECK